MEEHPIAPRSFFSMYFIDCFYGRARNRRYKLMVAKAQTKLERELDLRRFMKW